MARRRFRLNFDLHRACGLWLWPLLLVFAWSSVYLVDQFGFFEWVMPRLFDYQGISTTISEALSAALRRTSGSRLEGGTRGWRETDSRAGRAEGFKVIKPVSLNFFTYSGRYNYTAQTDRVFPHDRHETVFFDANTGDLAGALGTHDKHFGNTVANWLRALHMITDPVDYLTYRCIVCVVGLGIAMLSFTGVYIWWKKWQARRYSRLRVRAEIGEAAR